MKMTDVITKLREVNPAVQEASCDLGDRLTKVVNLTRDAEQCRTEDGRKAIIEKLLVAALDAKIAYDGMGHNLSELDAVTKSYTRVFEAAGQIRQDDERRQHLPGFEPSEESAGAEPSGGTEQD